MMLMPMIAAFTAGFVVYYLYALMASASLLVYREYKK